MLAAPLALAAWFAVCPQYGNPACPDHTDPVGIAVAFRAASPLALEVFLWLGVIVVYVYPVSYLGLAAVFFKRSPVLSIATAMAGWSGSMAWGFIADSMVHTNTLSQLGLDAGFAREQALFFTAKPVLAAAIGWVIGHQLAYVFAGVAILRTNILPRWIGATLIVSVILMGPIAYGSKVGALQVLGYILVFVASVPAAKLLLRGPRTTAVALQPGPSGASESSMLSQRHLPCALVACLLLTPRFVVGQTELGAVRGTVLDATTGAGIGFAQIVDRTTGAGVLADSLGRFQLASAGAGEHRLIVYRAGYRRADTTMALTDAAAARIVIRLVPQATTLAPVVAQAEPIEHERLRGALDPSVIGLSITAGRDVPPILAPDALRIVQLLPGVTTGSDRGVGFNVQGGSADENAIVLDGIPLVNPDHFLGVFGTFIDGMLGDVALHEAGFGASYGGRLSSVLDVASAEPLRSSMHGALDLSLLASSATVGGTADSGRVTWLVGARRTYADLVARAAGGPPIPAFDDVQAHARYGWGNSGYIGVTALSSHDYLRASLDAFGDTTNTFDGRVSLGRRNQAFGLTATHTLPGLPLVLRGDSVVVLQRASVTVYRTDLDFAAQSFVFLGGVNDLHATTMVTRFRDSAFTRLGWEGDRYDTRYQLGAPRVGAASLDGAQHFGVLAVFGEQESRFGRFIVRPGIRYEAVPAAAWSGWSPRFAAKFVVSDQTALTVSGGRYSQWLHYSTDPTSAFPFFDYWVGSDRSVPVAVARSGAADLEHWVGPTRFIRVGVFAKRYDEVNETNPAADPRDPTTYFFRERGSAYGATLFARQLDLGPIGGWLSYTYALAVRTRGDTTFAPWQDRRHTAHLTIRAHRRRTILAAQIGLGTGAPYTPEHSLIRDRAFDPVTGTWTLADSLPVHGAFDSARFPAYARLDVSVSREYHPRGLTVTPTLSIINVLDRANVFAYSYDFTAAPATQHPIAQLPILPSLGVRIDF
jgi:hypothetical protein